MSAAALAGVLLLLAAFSSSRRLQRVRRSLWLVHLATSGYLFLVIGYLLGLTRGAFGDPELHPELLPVAAMLTGWIGFSVGMAFHARVLRPLPWRAFKVALAPGAAALVVVGAASLLTFVLAGVRLRTAIAGAALLGAAAATSAPTLAAALRTRGRPTRRTADVWSNLRMIEFSAGLDVALALGAGVIAFAVTSHGVADIGAPLWLLLTLGAAVAVGIIAWLFLGAALSDDERLLLGIGMIAFGAGFGSWLGLSPVVIGAVAGMVLVNLPGDRMTLLRRALANVERPALVIVLVITGYLIAGAVDWLMLLLVPFLTLLRGAAKVRAARFAHGEIAGVRGLKTGPRWGAGLVSQGHVGLVLALDYLTLHPQPFALTLLAAVALSGLINEIAAPTWMRRSVEAAAGEATRPPAEAGGRDAPASTDSGVLGITGAFRRAIEEGPQTTDAPDDEEEPT
jgi:hypothetical protein